MGIAEAIEELNEAGDWAEGGVLRGEVFGIDRGFVGGDYQEIGNTLGSEPGAAFFENGLPGVELGVGEGIEAARGDEIGVAVGAEEEPAVLAHEDGAVGVVAETADAGEGDGADEGVAQAEMVAVIVEQAVAEGVEIFEGAREAGPFCEAAVFVGFVGRVPVKAEAEKRDEKAEEKDCGEELD
jgi:hypothetical protein